ncbi:MAG: glycosyltransferase family 4 protein [Chthoniobacterales bacterium]|nr:glycosyltransferase family 4 protein [Chthoniobacterales bacterium]
MKIIHHERKRLESHFSIERLFAEIRRHMPPDCEVESCPAPYASAGFLPRWRNVRHASKQKADVHHIVGDSHYLAFGLPPEKTVLTIHDCAALDRLTGWKRALLKYFWFTGPMRRAAVVTTISQATKEELRKWVGPLAERVVVVPDCVFEEFIYDPKPFNEQAPVVLQVGTKWNKNVERVAEAIAPTGCRLHVIGDLEPEQRSKCQALGIPYCARGAVSDEALVQAYRQCDIVVFASLYEGFGLPILEAQATGRPVITSRISSLPEAAGDGALLVDPYSVDDIRAAVMRVVQDAALRAALVEKGLRNAERFRPEVVAARYAGIYRKVAEEA